MFRRMTAGVCCALVVSVSILAAGVQDRQVLVTVLDSDDTPVTGLDTSQFLVYEDGQSRTVTAATKATEPLSVMVLLDTTKSPMGTPEPTRDVRTAVQTFVKTVFAGGAETQMAIMEYAGAGVQLRSFTAKAEDVEKAASRIVPNQRANSVLLETLPDAAKDLGKRPGPRRAIVILDRGGLETSRVPGDRIADEVRKSGASVWVVSIPSAVGSSPNREVVLDVLVEATGGMRLTAVSAAALEGMMKKVADALVSQYVVTYTPGPGTPKSIVPAAKTGTKFLRAPWVR